MNKSADINEAIKGFRPTAAEAGIHGKTAISHAKSTFKGDFRNGDFFAAEIPERIFSGDFRGARFDGAQGSCMVVEPSCIFDSESSFAYGAFYGANFRGVNFNGARMFGAIFDGADVRGADFTGCDMTGCYFTGTGTGGRDAKIDGMIVEGANMRDARMPKNWRSRVIGTPAQMPREQE